MSMAQGTLFFPYFLCHVALYSVILHRTGKLPACFLRAFFYHLSSECLINSTATFNRLKSKLDTCCLLPYILNQAGFCKEIISTWNFASVILVQPLYSPLFK